MKHLLNLALVASLSFGVQLPAHGFQSSAAAKAPTVAQDFEGYWVYTDLITKDGKPMPLTGSFLLDRGRFVQMAVFKGDPQTSQEGMAHSGSYEFSNGKILLNATQTIAFDPASATPINFQGATKHVLNFARTGDKMTLTFGSGTVQKFQHISDGETRILKTPDGQFALIGHNFILVDGDESNAVAVRGHILDQDGSNYTVEIQQFISSDAYAEFYRANFRAQMYFDGQRVKFSDGETFALARPLTKE